MRTPITLVRAFILPSLSDPLTKPVRRNSIHFGGTLLHHHPVGVERAPWMSEDISAVARAWMSAVTSIPARLFGGPEGLSRQAMRKVVLVDDNENVLQALGEFLHLAAGVECLRFHGMSELVGHEDEVCNSGVVLAILDINLGDGKPSGIDIYHWLRSRDFPGKIAFLTAHAKDHPLVVQASLIGGAQVFTKPMGAEKLVELIQEQA